MARVTGDLELRVKMDNLSDEIADEVFKAVYAAGNMIAAEAALSIVKGAVSGKGHVPSMPGEPPNANNRQLDTNIINVADRATMTSRVISQAPYSAALEYGTQRMAARPFMRPTLKAHAGEARDMMAAGVRKALKGGKL